MIMMKLIETLVMKKSKSKNIIFVQLSTSNV